MVSMGNNNAGPTWCYNNRVMYVHKLVITNGEITEFKLSLGQRIRAWLGIGPSHAQLRLEAEAVAARMGLLAPAKAAPEGEGGE